MRLLLRFGLQGICQICESFIDTVGIQKLPKEFSPDTNPEYNIERFAIWLFNGQFCLPCGEHVKYRDVVLEPIVPPYLAKYPNLLWEHLRGEGLPADYDVNACYNWEPRHYNCNKRKSHRWHRSTYLVNWLQRAMKNEERVQKFVREIESAPWRIAVILILHNAMLHETMSDADSTKINRFIRFLEDGEIRIASGLRVSRPLSYLQVHCAALAAAITLLATVLRSYILGTETLRHAGSQPSLG